MLLSVLRFGLVLVTVLVAGVNSSCPFPKTCPCGSNGKNYTRCYNTTIEQYSCERWSNCQTCDNNNELCVTCPPGRSGPTCKDGSCPFLKRPRNGVIQCSYDSTGFRSCTGRCFPGYYFENLRMTEEITLNCEQNAWTPRQEIPDCKSTGRDCKLFGIVNHSYNCTIGMHGSVCDINCSGKRQGRYYCYPGRGWNSTLPSCVSSREQYLLQVKKEKVICPDPGKPGDVDRIDLKGNSIPSDYVFREGDVVLYFCKRKNTPFERFTYLTCKPDSNWAGTFPRCAPAQKEEKVQSESSCKHPGVLENGVIEDFESDTDEFPVGTELKFVCREGYQIQGPEAIYCLLNLSWSEAPPVCTRPTTTPPQTIAEIYCKHPGVVENGMIENYPPKTERFPVGTALKFQCRRGYELVGPTNLYCIRNGEWSKGPPNCRFIPKIPVPVVSCVHPGMIDNGRFDGDLSESSFRVGTALKIHCSEGTQIEGPSTIFCLQSGQWSQAPPSCKSISQQRIEEGKKAPQSPCKHPGTVENSLDENSASKVQVYRAGSEIKFKCREGYTIEGADTLHCRDTGEWTSAPPTCRPTQWRNLPIMAGGTKLF